MLSRRSFLRSSVIGPFGLVAANNATANRLALEAQGLDLTDYERTLANLKSLDLLGRPRSWSQVRQGLHPISPERVVVMAEKGDGWCSRNWKREERLRERLAQLNLPASKLDLILRLMQVMTDYYRTPHLFDTWATGLAKREALASTGCGYSFALLHQYQDAGHVRLANSSLDWWLLLFPQGVEWEALDGEPVYGMIGHVFPPHHYPLPGLKLRVYELTSRSAFGVVKDAEDYAAWQRLARLDRINAARRVNQAIARCVAEPPFRSSKGIRP